MHIRPMAGKTVKNYAIISAVGESPANTTTVDLMTRNLKVAPGSRFSPHPQVVSQRLGYETVLVHLLSDRIFRLSGTATRIWELMEAGLDMASLLQQLLQEYDVEAAQLETETTNLMAKLLADDLIIVCESQ
jgi:hypothetical protein